MKKLLALLLLACASLAHGAPAVVQTSSTCSFPQGGAGSTCVITFTGITATNSIVVASFGASNDPGGTTHVSCNDGTGYTEAVYRNVNSGGNIWNYVVIVHLHNVGSGTHTITCTNPAGTFASYGYACAAEISGIQNAAADATNGNTGNTSTTPTTGSATPTTTSSIAIAVVSLNDFGNPASFGHPPSGYSSRCVITNGTAAGSGSVDSKILSSIAAENPSFATSANVAWAAAIAIYKAPSASSSLLLRRQR
jgi:hypothetical protein